MSRIKKLCVLLCTQLNKKQSNYSFYKVKYIPSRKSIILTKLVHCRADLVKTYSFMTEKEVEECLERIINSLGA